MSDDQQYAGDVTPKEAWEMLGKDPSAMLVDVRTQAEWTYVGVPDPESLSKHALFVQWQIFPDMNLNPEFIQTVAGGGVGEDDVLLFICRSGVRSRDAAIAMTLMGFTRCYNVSAGFEGDRDGAKHRGAVNGWKVDGLPWAQT